MKFASLGSVAEFGGPLGAQVQENIIQRIANHVDVVSSYVNYSNIAARVLRQSVKGAKKEEKGAGTFMRFFHWVNGEILLDGKKPDKAAMADKPA